jgi:SAC3 family protein LENG8/THP3
MYSAYQPLQQPHTVVQQPELVWNGTAWVAAAEVPAATSDPPRSTYNQYSQYESSSALAQLQHQQHQVVPVVQTDNKRIPAANPVATYTAYYHGWTAVATKAATEKQQQQQQHNAASAPELEQQETWAKYYADLSSRAAHYFHENPSATVAPYDLPPAPPRSSTTSPPPAPATTSIASSSHEQQHQNTNFSSSSQQQKFQQSQFQQQPHNLNYSQHSQQQQFQSQFQQQQQQQPFVATSSTPSYGNYVQQVQQKPATATPMSFQSYADQCLAQCHTADDKEAMRPFIQELIQRSLVSGDFHKKDWSHEPLLAVPGRGTVPAVASAATTTFVPFTIHNPANTSYNANTYTAATATLNRSNHDVGSYYGPTDTTTTFPTSPSLARGGGFNNNNMNNSAAKFGQHTNPQYGSSSKKKRKFDIVAAAPVLSNLAVNDSYYGPVAPSSPSSSSSSSSSFTGNKNKKAAPKSNKWSRKQAAAAKNARTGFDVTQSAMGHRAKRFASSLATYTATTADSDGDAAEAEALKKSTAIVVGTCQTLEKEYFRLTSAPKPEVVRPQYILEQHLANLKELRSGSSAAVAAASGHRQHEYLWFCSQLKAIRQDCTVQHLSNAFCVDVYETHAKIALEEGDLNEYNQCQTQLKYLYALLSSKNDNVVDVAVALRNMDEFVAYRLLYTIFLTGNQKYDGGSSDLFKIMLSLSAEQRQCSVPIQHALQVREAVASFDYHAFFRLLQNCPTGHGKFLMNRILPSIRQHALQVICRVYRPSVSVDFVIKELGLHEEEEKDGEDSMLLFGKMWLQSCGCVLSDDETEILTKETVVRESDLETKQSLI